MVVALIYGCYWYRHFLFPYGSSHCCIKNLYFSLRDYAEEHNGCFPKGEKTPEASFSLLYRELKVPPKLLCGKTVSEEVSKAMLESGKLLGPDTCGWYYVEGLTLADDDDLAIVWDKIPGLGHNGQHASDGGREVAFIGGIDRWISGKEWPAFLERQRELMAKRTPEAIRGQPLFSASIRFPDGKVTDRFDGKYKMPIRWKGPGESGSSDGQGDRLEPGTLRWYRPLSDNGTVEMTLSFSNMQSDTVTLISMLENLS